MSVPRSTAAVPATSWCGGLVSDRVPVGRAALAEALGVSIGVVGRLQRAGFISLPSTVGELAWLLDAKIVDCGQSIPLIVTSTPAPRQLAAWTAAFADLPSRGFPYDEAADSRLLVVGTGGVVTGVLRIERIRTSSARHRLTLVPVARLIPAGGGPPRRELLEPETGVGEWAGRLLAARYVPAPGRWATIL